MTSPLTNALFRLMLIYLAGMIFAWGWVIHQLIRQGSIELPSFREKRSSPPWGLGTMVLVLLVYLGVNIGVIQTYLRTMGYEQRTNIKAQHEGQAKPKKPGPKINQKEELKPKEAPESTPTSPSMDRLSSTDSAESPLSVTEGMFLLTLINEILIVAIPSLIRLTSRARLIDLGLTSTNWIQQLLIGAGAALFIAPIVYSIQFIAVLIWSPNDHPIQDMIRDQFTPPVAYLALLSAVVMAPIIEEIIFRGLVQNWLYQLASRKFIRIPPSIEGSRNDTFPTEERTPFDEVSVRISSRRAATQSIVMTSLFFAIVHSAQWPAPIPILLLSVALGFVYHVTGSLLASIAMHATFNSISTLMLFLAMSGNPEVPKVKSPLPESGLMTPSPNLVRPDRPSNSLPD